MTTHPDFREPIAHKAYVAFVQICKGGSDDAGTYDADEELVRSALKRLNALETAPLSIPPPERGHWSEGVCGDGAAILLDGVMQPIEDVIAALNTPPLAPIPSLEDAFATLGYQYGEDAMDNVKVGWELRGRYGSAVVPIPVSERLPVAEDCDAEGRCWFFFLLSNDPTWTLEHYNAAICSGRSHWLPHWAIPLPEES